MKCNVVYAMNFQAEEACYFRVFSKRHSYHQMPYVCIYGFVDYLSDAINAGTDFLLFVVLCKHFICIHYCVS